MMAGKEPATKPMEVSSLAQRLCFGERSRIESSIPSPDRAESSSLGSGDRQTRNMATAENAMNIPTARDLEYESTEVLIAHARTAALSVTTRETYDTGWRNWTRWAGDNARSALPADPNDLEAWLAELVRQE